MLGGGRLRQPLRHQRLPGPGAGRQGRKTDPVPHHRRKFKLTNRAFCWRPTRLSATVHSQTGAALNPVFFVRANGGPDPNEEAHPMSATRSQPAADRNLLFGREGAGESEAFC
jgi:hypothetical protein